MNYYRLDSPKLDTQPRLLRMAGVPVTLAALMLGGCAGELAFRAGNTLVEQGRTEEALVQYEQAVQQSPRDAKFKLAVISLKNQTIDAYIVEMERLIGIREYAQAADFAKKVLALDARNERARKALAGIELSKRLDLLLDEATKAYEKNDVDLARARLQAILMERPDHPAATALQKKLNEKITSNTGEKVLGAAFRKPITIDFKDATVKQVFEVIARSSGLNILFDREVRTDQKMSIFLKNSTIETALYYALVTNQLERRTLDSNTIMVYPNSPGKQKDYQDLVVRTFYLANSDAKTVAATLKTILKLREVVPDEKLNLIFVRDSPEAIALAEKLVALQDVAEPEVMLEVEILEVKRTRLQELGIRWPNSLTLTPLPSTVGGALLLSDLKGINSANTSAVLGPAVVNARLDDGITNILANPRIRVRNRSKAKILIGDRVPNITTTVSSGNFAAESIAYIEIGLKLEVEPTVFLDGAVSINVALEVSNIVNQIQTKSGSLAYQIGTRNATTVLRLNDGETQVLAGLINDQDRTSGNKLPFIGEVPVVGRLFGSTLDDSQKTEIVLSITPRVIRNVQRASPELAEFASGTEAILRNRPDVVVPIVAPPAGASAAATAPPTSGAIMPIPVPQTTAPTSNPNAAGGVAPANGAQRAIPPAPGPYVPLGGVPPVPPPYTPAFLPPAAAGAPVLNQENSATPAQ